MSRTRKVGSTGRFGVRYGRKVRQRLIRLEQTKKHTCPACLKTTLKRQAAGIWICRKCNLKFAGKAYTPK